jgi:amino acid adenylation domain-containing protein
VDAWDGKLTYNTLDAVSGTIAAQLQRHGVRPGVFVPICFDKTRWAVAAMLGINKTGGAFVPCDPSHPLERRREIIQRVQASIAVTSPEQAHLFTDCAELTLIIVSDAILELPRQFPKQYHRADSPKAPAYVLFTSGSTGQPKGCEISHKAFASISQHISALYLTSQTRALQFASYSFGMAIIEVFCTLCAGGTVCIPSSEQRLNSLAATMTEMQVDWALMTPTVLGSLHPKDLPYLRHLFIAGEAPNVSQVKTWSRSVSLSHAYGLTEWTGIFAVSKPITTSDELRTIGIPAHARAWLIDPGDPYRLAPIGAPGELVIAGEGLSSGYLGDKERSRRSFLSGLPWLEDWTETNASTRVYSTGDVMRYNSDGSLSYIGRKDHQVKIRGMRVELGEVESKVLECLPDAKRAIALVMRPQGSLEMQVLAAFILFKHAQSPSAPSAVGEDTKVQALILDSIGHAAITAAKQRLSERLPDYMLPQYLLPVRSLPTTITGKMDRQKLSWAASQLTVVELQRWTGAPLVQSRLPSTKAEQMVHDMTSELLGLGDISMMDNFFSLAGDSVAAMKLVGMARRRGATLTVADVFNHPVLAELATVIQIDRRVDPNIIQPFGLLPSGTKTAVDVIREVTNQCQTDPSQVIDAYPCTPLQEGLCALSVRDPRAYKARVVCELKAGIEASEVRKAWERIVELNDILRTRLVASSGQGTIQAVLREKFRWDYANDYENYRAQIDEEPMGIGKRLVRACILSASSARTRKHTLVLTIHHALCDRWSIMLLLEQMQTLISGQGTVEERHFRPFIAHISDVKSTLSDYWKTQFGDLKAVVFPELPDSEYTPNVDSVSTFHIRLPQRPVRDQITIASRVRLAWALVLAYNTNSEDVVFGSTVTGRSATLQGIEDLSGPTIATVPLRIKVNRGESVASALANLQKQLTGMIPFEQAGLQNIQQYSFEAASACQFQSHLTVQPAYAKPLSIFEGYQEGAATPGGFASYALCLECNLTEDGTNMEVSVAFDSIVVHPNRVERLVDHLEWVLSQLLQSQEQSLASVMGIGPSDLRKLMDWNAVVPSKPCVAVHQVIQANVSTAPRDTAICASDGELTYEELDWRSGQLAVEILAQGGGPGTLIPLYFEKSRWAVVAMLAVLKMGGGIVLLDPSYPNKRIQAILAQTNSQVIISSRELATKQIVETIGLPLVVVDAKSPIWKKSFDPSYLPTVTAESIFYLIFTSGSTGEPKGLVVDHGSFIASARDYKPVVELSRQSRVLQFSSFAFDATFIEIFATLMAGGCVCIPSEEARMNDIHSAIRDLQITHGIITPSYARLIKPETVPSLKVVWLVGEAVRASDVAKWAHRVRLLNGYGPAECAAITTVQHYERGKNINPRDIGHPCGCVLWVCDPQNYENLLPVGATGELYIEGPNIGGGYVDDPVRTAAAFLEPPRWLQELRRGSCPQVYKTGDLVRFTEDGRLHYVGRIGEQFKLRGQRIEPSSVEHRLLQDFEGAVEVAAIIVAPRGAEDRPILVALILERGNQNRSNSDAGLFATPTKGFSQRSGIARNKMQERLPEFMVPSVMIPVYSMPHNASGKLDRRRLQQEITARTREELMQYEVSSGSVQAAATETERELQAIWARVLHLPVETIGVDQSFFSFGGDSITAMLVVAEARTCRLGLTVMVNDIFRLRTIRHIAAYAEHNQTNSKLNAGNDVFDMPFPMLPVQQLFFDTNPAGENRFSHNLLLHLNRPITYDGLNTALERLVEVHPMLRARFRQRPGGSWEQVIPSYCPRSFRCQSHSVTGQAMMQKTMAKSQEALDIVSGPIFSADLIELNGGQCIFLLAHHLVVDMISWTVILPHLETALSGRDIQVSPSTSFQSWCRLLANHGANNLSAPDHSMLDKSIPAFWGASKAPNTFKNTTELVLRLDEQTTEAILGPANKPLGTQPNELIFAALSFAFTEIFPGRPAARVFLEGHGREPWTADVDLTQTVGWFTTLAPVILDRCASHDIFEAVRIVKDARRRLSKNGLDAFTERYHNTAKKKAADAGLMEIVFNYGGRFHQQLNRTDSLFEVGSLRDLSIFDAAPALKRWSLVDINSFVEDGLLTMTFTVPKGCSRTEVLDPWIAKIKSTLNSIATEFIRRPRSYTLTDFPSLNLEYGQLERLLSVLSIAQIDVEDIEGIYPCAPIQRGILLSQAKNPAQYHVAVTWEVATYDGHPAVVERVRSALEQVVARFSCLRTCFIETTSQDGAYDQVVLETGARHRIPVIYSRQTGTEALADIEPGPELTLQHPSQFTILVSWDETVYVRLDISHALADAESFELIRKDLSRAYDGLLGSDKAPAYAEYIAFLETQNQTRAHAFWENYLEDCEPCLFPALAEHVEGDEDTNNDVVVQIPDAETVHAYCKAHDVTAANVFCLAWTLVLRAYVGSDKMTFGYLTSGRDLPFDGADKIAGPLISMLTMCLDLGDPDVPVRDLLRKLQSEYLECLEYQTYSVADIIHAKRLVDRRLFNTALSIQRVMPGAAGAKKTALKVVGRQDPSEYAIALNIEIEKARIVVHFRHWSSALSNSQASFVASSFAQAVTQIVAHDGATPDQVDLVSPYHRSVLWSWNKTLPKAPTVSVHDTFRQRAAETPRAPAVCTSQGSLSYDKLNDLSDALARYLLRHDLEKNPFIPLCFEKGYWTVVALLAVIKAGRAFVLLDATNPDNRLQTVCNDLGNPIMLASSSQYRRCTMFTRHVVQVGGDDDLWHRRILNVPMPHVNVTADSPFCAVFTSGSTGKPKAAISTHGSISAMLQAVTPLWNVTPSARFSQFASYAFDASLLEMLLALTNGAALCILSEVERRDSLAESMKDLGVTHCFLTPSVARMMTPETVPNLRLLGCGGEPMTQVDRDRWAGSVRLLNAYGPAECSIVSAVQPCVGTFSRPDNIGRPTGCAAWVVDPTDPERLVPIGALGELLVEGPIVGKGYINNPEATRAAFVGPPRWLRQMRKDVDPTKRLYRTGDLVRYQADGQVLIAGRKDTQIKIRGQRIELGEVEFQVHSSFADARQVVVELAKGGQEQTPSLYAFISSEAAETGSDQVEVFLEPSEEFRSQAAAASAQLFDRLPAYMVPSYFVPIVKVPLNPSGKMDRKRLRTFLTTLTAETSKLYRPLAQKGSEVASPEERLLQSVWADVLGLDVSDIGGDAHFFQVGGDSVNAMKVAAAVRREGLEISVADIFAHPKLSALACTGQAKEMQQFEPVPFSLCPAMDHKLFSAMLRARGMIPPLAEIVDILPASEGQAFFLERPTLHHFMFETTGKLDIPRLRDACEKVFRQFPILRTVFVRYQGQILQVVLDNVPVPFHHIVSDEDPAEINERFRSADREAVRLLDTAPFAFILFSTPAAQKAQLVFRISHAQWDGLSVGNMFNAVGSAYHEKPMPATPPLSDVIYYRAARDKTRSLEFWQDYLQGAQITSLTDMPSRHPDYSLGTTIWENTNLQPPPEPPKGFTMATVVKAAWALVLAQERGARDLTFGQTVNGRSSPLQDMDKILGCCLNFIPVRVKIQPGWTVSNLLEHIQTQYRQTVAHDDIGFKTIVDKCTDWAQGTLLDTIVQHQNIPLSHLMPLEGIETKFSLHGYFRPSREIFIFTEPYEDLLSVQLCVNPNVMGLDRAQKLHAKLAGLIVGLCERPNGLIVEYLEGA